MKFGADKFCQVVHAVTPASYTSDTYSSAIDTRGYEEALVLIIKGVAGTTSTMTCVVQESVSTTGASFAHISGASFSGISPTAATKATEIGRIDLRGRKRYLRVYANVTGSNGVIMGADVVLLNPKIQPATASSTVKFTI